MWAPFGEPSAQAERRRVRRLKPEIGQVMGAVWQIVTTGTDRQRRDAIEILVETRRKLYGLLADGDDGPADPMVAARRTSTTAPTPTGASGDGDRAARAADRRRRARPRRPTSSAEHYAQGRLTAEEHSERLDRIWAARTRGDLRRSSPTCPAARTAPRRRTPRPTARRVGQDRPRGGRPYPTPPFGRPPFGRPPYAGSRPAHQLVRRAPRADQGACSWSPWSCS